MGLISRVSSRTYRYTMERVLEQQLLQVAENIEQQIDQEMKQLEQLEDDELDKIREKRLVEMKKLQDIRQDWLRAGHGKLNEINSDKDFFEEAKGAKKMVVHFYRNTTMRCKLLDEHLKTLSKKHLETKFLKLDVDKCDWIVERLNIRVIPTLAFVKDGKTKDYMRGFDDLGGTDDFTTDTLEWRLGMADIITYKGDLKNPPGSKSKKDNRGTRIIR